MATPVMIITGTSKGIGKGLAEYFLNKGYRVFGCSRSEATITHAAYHHTALDVSNESAVRLWIRTVKKEGGRIDVLVCNAGLVESALQMTVTPGDVLEAYLKTNVAGTYYVCRETAKTMLLQKQGRIITISSIMTRLHAPGTSVYSATKSAIEQMTKVLAREMAPLGITCNVVAPSMSPTDAAKSFGPEWEKNMLAQQTIQRPITTDEIANVISFYAAPESACITGQVTYMGLVD
ncbi:SDR family oxidoreductase [bacterium]|nr:SDR family oxidoreductase [bacterium]NUN45012.1 SDR family oxidoreductase [bacterium]